MTPLFDLIHESRALAAPMDCEREYLCFDSGSLDAPTLIAAGSTLSIEAGISKAFHCTSYVFRPGD
jgi:hypothetical protein